MPGNPELGDKIFGVDAHGIEVRDPEGEPSNYIVEVGDPFTVELTLQFGGRLARWILCCLRWRICYCFGPLCRPGTGRYLCYPVVGWYDGLSNRLVYDQDATRLNVAAGTFPPDTYRLTAVVEFQWKHPCVPPIGRPPISAFTDGPPIQILQAEEAAAQAQQEGQGTQTPAQTA